MVEWNFNRAQPHTWLKALLALEWITPSIRAWIMRRAEAMGSPTADMDYVDAIKSIWNLIPCFVCGYFDDGMAGGPRAAIETVDRAIAYIMQNIGVAGSMLKFERGYSNGTKATRLRLPTALGAEEDPAAGPEFTDPIPGIVDILGKLIDTQHGMRYDKPGRLGAFYALLRAIAHQASTNPGRKVSEVALLRAMGQACYVTDTCTPLRAFTSSMIAALTTAKSWSGKSNNNDKRRMAGSMGKTAHDIFMHYESQGDPFFTPSETDAETVFQDWCKLDLGATIHLPIEADTQFEQLIAGLQEFNMECLMPLRAPPGEDAIWIMNDSAGLSAELDDTQRRAGACWFYSERWATIKWTHELWDVEVLKNSHSSSQELSNGSANLAYALHMAKIDPETWGTSCYIEVYDSLATTSVLTKMGARTPAMKALVAERLELVKYVDARFLVFWQARELGQPADDFSKFKNAKAKKDLFDRYGIPVERLPERRVLAGVTNSLNRNAKLSL